MKTLIDFFSEIAPSPSQETPSSSDLAMAQSQGGFVIQELELKGFMRYLDQARIAFPDRFMAIIGKTGSGKTSILDAITFALYKRTSRTDVGLKIEDICKQDGYVKLTFKQGVEIYEVTRGLNGKNPYLILKKNGRRINGKITELEAAIQDITGIDYTGFRNSTFVRQDEMKAIGSESGPERLEIFQKLFRLEIFERAKEVVDKKLADLTLELKSLSAYLESDSLSYEERQRKIPIKKQEIAEVEQAIKQNGLLYAELSKKIAEVQIACKSLEKVHEEYIKYSNRLAEIQKQIVNLKQKLSIAASKQASTTALNIEIAKLREEVRGIEEIAREKEKLEELQRQCELLQTQFLAIKHQFENALQNYNQEQRKLQLRLRELNQRIKALSSDLNKEAAFNLLREEGKLSERIERIPRELTWVENKREVAMQLEEELKLAKANLALVAEKTKQINIDVFLRSELENQLQRIQLDVEELEKKWQLEKQRLQSDMQLLEEKIRTTGFGNAEQARLNQLKLLVERKMKQRRELDSKIEEAEKIGDLNQLICELETQISESEAEWEYLKQATAKIEPEERKFEIARQELEGLREEHKKLEKIISAKEGEKAALQKALVDLEIEIKALKTRIAEREKELAAKRDLLEVYIILKENVFHKKGIVLYTLNQLLPQLAIEASSNLADLTGGRFTKLRLMPYEEANRYGIKIEVEGSDGAFHDVKEFSGGEKTQINAALRFAIAKELASMPQIGRSYARMKTLFIDEGDLGSLDSEVSRELFVKKLFDMGKFFDKVILITHLTEIADRFPSRLRVYMTEDERSRVEQVA
ncbi:MAG: SMC family ATPase [Methanocellales archaeon]